MFLIKVRKDSPFFKIGDLEVFIPENPENIKDYFNSKEKIYYNKKIIDHLIFCDFCGYEAEDSTILLIIDEFDKIYGVICENCLGNSGLTMQRSLEDISINKKIPLHGSLPNYYPLDVDLDPNKYIREIREQIIKEQGFKSDYTALMIYDEKVLPDTSTLAGIGVNPEKDIITLMIVKEQVMV